VPGPHFELNHVAREGRHTLELAGELDLVTAHELEGAVADLGAAGANEIVIDLRGLRFVDSTGLRAILTSWESCAGRCAFYVIPGSGSVQRLFELTGLNERLPFTAAEA